MHTESAYDGRVAFCYPEQGMAERLLHVHILSPVGLWAWMTLGFIMESELFAHNRKLLM